MGERRKTVVVSTSFGSMGVVMTLILLPSRWWEGRGERTNGSGHAAHLSVGNGGRKREKRKGDRLPPVL